MGHCLSHYNELAKVSIFNMGCGYPGANVQSSVFWFQTWLEPCQFPGVITFSDIMISSFAMIKRWSEQSAAHTRSVCARDAVATTLDIISLSFWHAVLRITTVKICFNKKQDFLNFIEWKMLLIFCLSKIKKGKCTGNFFW